MPFSAICDSLAQAVLRNRDQRLTNRKTKLWNLSHLHCVTMSTPHPLFEQCTVHFNEHRGEYKDDPLRKIPAEKVKEKAWLREEEE